MQLNFLITILLLMITAVMLSGQIDAENVFINRDTTSIGQESQKVKRNTFLSIFEGNPGRAAFYSLIIPGGGQIYNKKWLKAPLAWGIDGVAGYWVYFTDNTYDFYDGIYRDLLAGKQNEFFSSTRDVEPLRNAWRQRKEYAWVYMGIAHLVTVFDAFVDRHLIEFDINEDLTNHNYFEMGAFPIVSISIPLDRRWHK